jgi:PiT family inorganic phosphate transporter
MQGDVCVLLLVIAIIALALLFDFLNGMNDAANSIATVVSTGVLPPRLAVAWAAFFNFAAAGLFGVRVATTIGRGIVDLGVVDPWLILAALMGAILWTYLCTHLGLPISVSHALIGGLAGAAIVKGGFGVLILPGVAKVAAFIVLSPLIGGVLGFLFMILVFWIFRSTQPRQVDRHFRVGQLLSSAAYSLGHGLNDAQKTMGIITVLLFSAGYLPEFHVPLWVIFSSYSVIALGTLTGGWRVVHTIGVRLTKLRPVNGFCAETAGACSIFIASHFGIPVSTTHTIAGAIAGVGSTSRISAVRWGVASRIVWAWVLTLPCAAIVSGLLMGLIGGFHPLTG